MFAFQYTQTRAKIHTVDTIFFFSDEYDINQTGVCNFCFCNDQMA